MIMNRRVKEKSVLRKEGNVCVLDSFVKVPPSAVVEVPRKGTEFPCISKRAARFIDQLGHNRVKLKCDNEPAVEALAREIGQARQEASQTVPERPPVGECESNGVIERAVGLVAGQARTLEAAVEHRIGTIVPSDARILCKLVEFAAYLMNRCDVGSDGKTPLQRLHGRRDNTPILEFGEKILYMPANPARGRKWEARFHPGVFVECEPFHGHPYGSYNASDIQVGMERPTEVMVRVPGDVLMENKVVRTQLRRADFEQWGLSEGCLGCRYVRTGEGRQQAHSEACRRRIEGLLKGDPVGSARLAATDKRISRAHAVERHATNDPAVRGILKRSSVASHPGSESQKRVAMDTEQAPTPTTSCLIRGIIGVSLAPTRALARAT